MTLNKGIASFRLDCLDLWIEVLGLIVAQSLTGAGLIAVMMRISLGTQWLLFMPIVYVLCLVLGYLHFRSVGQPIKPVQQCYYGVFGRPESGFPRRFGTYCHYLNGKMPD